MKHIFLGESYTRFYDYDSSYYYGVSYDAKNVKEHVIYETDNLDLNLIANEYINLNGEQLKILSITPDINQNAWIYKTDKVVHIEEDYISLKDAYEKSIEKKQEECWEWIRAYKELEKEIKNLKSRKWWQRILNK